MAIRTSRTRQRAFSILVALTLGVIQLQLVTAGSATASEPCNGAFQGSPPGSLTVDPSISTNQEIQAGQSITITTTWDTGDWSRLDQFFNCWQLNGAAVDSLELIEKPPTNDGTIVQTITVP